jgi:hypothetical protein
MADLPEGLSQINSTNEIKKKMDLKLFNFFIVGFYTAMKLCVNGDPWV